MGRPKKDISEKQVENLASIGCTNEEIATVVDCCVDTLVNRFSDIIKRGREGMKTSLRRMQYTTAQKGNPTMQIWLGKQYLGQSDKLEQTNIDVSQLSDAELEAIAEGKSASGIGATATAEKPELIN
jgi:hypothetical protein